MKVADLHITPQTFMVVGLDVVFHEPRLAILDGGRKQLTGIDRCGDIESHFPEETELVVVNGLLIRS